MTRSGFSLDLILHSIWLEGFKLCQMALQPIGTDGELGIIDQALRESVEEFIHTDLDHSNIFIRDTAARARFLRFTDLGEVKKNAFGGTTPEKRRIYR
jgi:hypothetical protein